MTYKQFLVALKKARTLGTPTSDFLGRGKIRMTGMPGTNNRCCPIEAVAVATTGSTDCAYFDFSRLKMSNSVAYRVMDAADRAKKYSKTVRRDLLRALGLKEVKKAS